MGRQTQDTQNELLALAGSAEHLSFTADNTASFWTRSMETISNQTSRVLHAIRHPLQTTSSELNSLRGGVISLGQSFVDSESRLGVFSRGLDALNEEMGVGQGAIGMMLDGTTDLDQALDNVIETNDSLLTRLAAVVVAYGKKAKAKLLDIKLSTILSRGIWGNVAAMGAFIKSLAVGTALLLAKTAAAIGLNAALGGIPILIGIIVSAIAALGGAIVALGGPSEAWSSTIGGIREALGNMVEFLLKETVPIFNSIMTTIRAIMDPIYSLINGVFRIGEALGILSDEGSAGSSVINLLRTTVSALITAVELAWGVFASLTNIIGTLAGLIIDRLVGGIVNTINGLREIGGSIFNIAEGLPVIGRLIDAFRIFRELIAEIPGMLSAIPAILTDVMESVVNDAISLTNKLIRVLDNLPGVNISEVGKVSFDTKDTVTTDDVTEMMEADESDDVKKALDAPPDFDPELNIFQETSVSGTFNMAPEEEQRVKRLVEDAVEDANQFRRRRESGGG